jgi:hypothetical protein
MRKKAKNTIVPLYANKRYGADHHIWDNNGTWWVHFSITRTRGRAKRVRLSLHTKNRKLARERRDLVMKCAPDKIKALCHKWRLER